MLSRIKITGINLDLGDDIKKYITKKVGALGKYVPRQARPSAHVEVKLKKTNDKLGNKYECEALLRVPGTQLQATESTLNMFAAVDIVEAKLKNQLIKYRQAHIARLRQKHPGILGRLRVHLQSR